MYAAQKSPSREEKLIMAQELSDKIFAKSICSDLRQDKLREDVKQAIESKLNRAELNIS